VPAAPAAAELPQAPSSSASAPIIPEAPAQPEAMMEKKEPAPTGEALIQRLVVANPAPGTESNNPGRDLGPLSTFQVRPMYENLIGFDADVGALVPQLATSWSVEPDGISVRFLLRKGVNFHGDYGEFTSRDVVYTHAQITQEESTHPHRRRLILAKVEEPNDYEVVFRHSRANAEFMRMISEQVGSIQIQSHKAAGVNKSDPADTLGNQAQLTGVPLAGTNAYQFVSRTQGQGMLFERVPFEHWRSSLDFQELEFKWVAEASTRMAALLTDEVHLTQLAEDQKPQAAARGMVVANGKHGAQRVFVGFKGVFLDRNYGTYEAQNTPCGYAHCDSPFLDVRVRKAMNKAIDRNILNEAYFGNKGQIMVMNHHRPGAAYHNPAWDQNFESEYGFDPAASRALLAEAGYGPDNPLEIEVEISTHAQFSQSADVLESLAGYWQDVGIKANLDVTDAAARRAASRAFEYKNHVSFSATFSFDIQGWRVYNSHVPPRGGALELLETRDLVNTIQSTMDLDEQTRLMRELGDVAYPLHMGIYLYWIPAELVYNPKYVESYNFPGNISDLWTHYELIKAVRQ
jgi:peptide/nickel transport system substrate-binding protein